MPKPTTLPEWASDQTNNVEPSSGQKDTGWAESQVAVSDYFNWWQYLVYTWILWLSNRTVGFLPVPIDSSGTWVTSAIGTVVHLAASSSGVCAVDLGQHLMNGDRLTSIGWNMSGDGAADLIVTVYYYPHSGGAPTSLGTATITNESSTRVNKTLDVTDTTIDVNSTGGTYIIIFDANAAGVKIYHLWADVTTPP